MLSLIKDGSGSIPLKNSRANAEFFNGLGQVLPHNCRFYRFGGERRRRSGAEARNRPNLPSSVVK